MRHISDQTRRQQLEEVNRPHAGKLAAGDWRFSAGRLENVSPALPLHPNQRLLLETLYQLQPKSALEMGCGLGDNLYNLSILLSGITLYGFDFSAEQLKGLVDRTPELQPRIWQWDATWPFSNRFPIVDICYTHVVLMHINEPAGYLAALASLFRMAQEHVVMLENYETHNFMVDVQGLWLKQMIPWEPHFYYRESPELLRPHLMIVSRSDQLEYPVLADYRNTMYEPLLASADGKIGKAPGQVDKYPEALL